MRPGNDGEASESRRTMTMLDSYRTMRGLLRTIWHRTHAESFRELLDDESWMEVPIQVKELREIAALFEEDKR